MPLKKQIFDLHRKHKKSVSDNLSWYKDNFKNKKSTEVIELENISFLECGKIYRFIYKPATKDQLDFYDLNPLVISLGKVVFDNSILDLALNLNYFPYEIKWNLVNEIYSAYKIKIEQEIRQNPLNAKLQKSYKIDYNTLLKLFSAYNISYGIRNYNPNNRLKTACISFENFYRLPFIEEYHFIKENVKQIHNNYYRTLI
jgi:hypothetical protein